MKKKYIIFIIIFIIITLIVVNYLYMENYNFKLKGSETILLNTSDIWEDPLYEIDNDKKVERIDNIIYGQEGEYEVSYSTQIGLFKKKLLRKVIIYGEDKNTNFVFNMKGSNPYYLMINHNYHEDGFEVYDGIDGLLTDQVITTNNIDSNSKGNYEIRYQVKNSSGITKNKTRQVIVYSLKLESKLRNMKYATENEIILNISDNNYRYTILPNGEKTEEKQINYKVSENNTYLFKLYDINNDNLDYEVKVDNIDKEKPTGNCVLSLKNTGGEISVVATDDNQINGYEYYYGNNKTELIKNAKYTITTMDEKASVKIYDMAGNTNTITCKTVDNSSKTKRSYTIKTYSNKKYWLYEPSISKRSKVPLVIYFHGAGGSASINAVNNIALPKNIKDGSDFPYYVLAPYNAHNASSESYILELINYLTKNYQIDTSRIVLTGGSMGSVAPLRMAAKYPNKFSCIVIIAAYNITSINANTVTKIPIWVFQGSNDSYSRYKSYVNAINKAGGNAKITSYRGGHDAPVNAFLREDLTNWILNNKTK